MSWSMFWGWLGRYMLVWLVLMLIGAFGWLLGFWVSERKNRR